MLKAFRNYINNLGVIEKFFYIIVPTILIIMISSYFILRYSDSLETYISQEQRLNMGVDPGEQTIASLQAYETLVGRKQDYFLYFANWGSSYGIQTAKDAIAYGTTPYLTWEPHGKTLDGIKNGSYDAYIKSYAQGLKGVPGTVLLRPMHEMNGNWYDWGYPSTTNPLSAGNTPVKFVDAWKHIHAIFVAEGATNVKFVWSPNNEGPPNWNSLNFRDYYPGDTYVDYAAIDAYNFGTSATWSNWRSFDSLFKNAYTTTTSITTKPILVGETASTELGGSKATWIHDAFTVIKSSYPKIVGITWFNINKETDWRVNSSSASLTAFKEELAKLPAVIVPADTTQPTISITAPSSGATISGSVAVSASATDNKGVSRVEFYVDNVLKSTDTISAYGFTLDTTTLTNASHTLLAKAYDAAGNSAQSSAAFTASNSSSGTSTTTSSNLAGTVLGGAVSLQTLSIPKTGNVAIDLKWNGNGNLDLELLDPSGVVVASSKTSNKPEKILKSVTTIGTYKIRVTNVSSKKINYTLTVIKPN